MKILMLPQTAIHFSLKSEGLNASVAFGAYAFNFAWYGTSCATVKRGQGAARSFQLRVGPGDAGGNPRAHGASAGDHGAHSGADRQTNCKRSHTERILQAVQEFPICNQPSRSAAATTRGAKSS